MLQPLRLSVKGNQPVDPKAYIFVQDKLEREGLEPLEYTNADLKADAAVEFFKNVLEFKAENVVVCRDYSKAQVIQLLDKLHKEAEIFGNNSQNSSSDVNALYIYWIGFCIRPDQQ